MEIRNSVGGHSGKDGYPSASVVTPIRSHSLNPKVSTAPLGRLFRGRLLAKLVEARAISKALVAKLLAGRHPGYSAHVGGRIAAEDKQRLEGTAAYLVRIPLSLKKLLYLDGQQAVLYRSKLNPLLGRNFESLDPLEWLARMSDHIPEPRQHRTLFTASTPIGPAAGPAQGR